MGERGEEGAGEATDATVGEAEGEAEGEPHGRQA